FIGVDACPARLRSGNVSISLLRADDLLSKKIQCTLFVLVCLYLRGLVLCQVRFSLRQCDLKIARIHLYQNIALFDQLTVIHMHRGHAAGDFWRHGNKMDVNERIVGGLVSERMKHHERAIADSDDYERRGGDNYARSAKERLLLVFV